MKRRVKAAAVAVLVAVLATLAQASPSSAATTTTRATTVTARHLVAVLPVRGESGAGYNRAYFKHWTDANRDCQDTRAEVLIAESRVAPSFTSSRRCTVSRGRWISPWDFGTWAYASDVDIDHVVALKEAWDSGARLWGPVNKERYANDLGYAWTLEAVTDNVNSSKSDRDPAQWLPPSPSARCSYVIKWAAVKYRWKLSVDPAERTAMLNIASGSCGTKRVNVPARAL